jgi:hypothetical protein
MLKYSRTGDSPRKSVRARFPPLVERREKSGAASPGRRGSETAEGCGDVEQAAIIAKGITSEAILTPAIAMSLARGFRLTMGRFATIAPLLVSYLYMAG